MATKRVYEIARERGLETRQVMRRLKSAGVSVKAAASTVEEADIERVFGKKQPSASPATQQNLPSWLTPSAAGAPKTTTRSEMEAEQQQRQKKLDAANSAKQKAVEQAKRLRAEMLEKKRQQAAAQASAKAQQQAAEAAVEAAEAEAAEPVVEDEAPAAAEPETQTPVADTEPVEAPQETAPEPVGENGSAAASPAAPEAPAEPEEPAEPVALTEAELRRRAQTLASQKVAEAAAKKRAEAEAQRLEEETRARSGAKKKEKKKGKEEPGAAEPSRGPRVGGPSREPLLDSERGGRGGRGKRRRVIIDAQASRRGAPHERGGGRSDKRRESKAEVIEVDLTQPVTIHAGASVKELAEALRVGATEVIKVLMQAGDFVTITQTLTNEQIETVGIGLDPPREIIVRSAADEEEIPVFEDAEDTLVARAPVVTIMGHVDHGKTSLLDAIRQTKVAEAEAGGITQHIGAYQVRMPDGRSVTFLDTPGHEAFTALRARGAKVTDEAVLVVAADDGVKPQTVEALDHARAAGVPIVVAINKIDKENAAPERVKSELAQHDLQPEEWGGNTVMVEVSAKQRQNLDELIEMILLQADVLELKANPDTEASGYIIESRLDPGRGPLATMLVQRGTLRVGDVILAGDSWGKVRAMLDFRGKRATEAGPAMPVEIVGFDSVPTAGEFCQVVESERVAREKAQRRAQRLKAEQLAKRQRGLTLEDFFTRVREGEVADLNLIVKADVAGSVEAIEQELGKIKHEEVAVRIIHSGVGGITGNDVMLAAASNAIILGFNVRPNVEARQSAEREGVDVRTYRIIYKLREDVENALAGLLRPEQVEETLGEAEVRQIFRASRIGTIAGCYVTNGTIERNARLRVLRDGTVVHEGEISSLKRFKEDVREVAQGFECGISVENFNDVKEGDVFEAYTIREVARDVQAELAGAAS